MIAVLILALFNGLVYGGVSYKYKGKTYTGSTTTDNVRFYMGDKFFDIEMLSKQLTPNETMSVLINNLGTYDCIDGQIPYLTTGNITTAKIVWKIAGNVSVNNETLTFGTPVMQFMTPMLEIQIQNPDVSITNNITGNILFSND